jgi:cytochrome c
LGANQQKRIQQIFMSKKLVARLTAILSCTLLFAACGGSGESKPAETKDSAATTVTTPPATVPGEKGLELIGASDCTTCHRLHQSQEGSTIGPAYDLVATRYSPAADSTVDRLVKKILSGGYGIWGAIPMTPHPSLQAADVRTMVKYILSLKK